MRGTPSARQVDASLASPAPEPCWGLLPAGCPSSLPMTWWGHGTGGSCGAEGRQLPLKDTGGLAAGCPRSLLGAEGRRGDSLVTSAACSSSGRHTGVLQPCGKLPQPGWPRRPGRQLLSRQGQCLCSEGGLAVSPELRAVASSLLPAAACHRCPALASGPFCSRWRRL